MSDDYYIRSRVHTETLIPQIVKRLGDMAKDAVDDDVKYQAAEMFKNTVEKYVPMSIGSKDSGALRIFADVVPYKGTYATLYYGEGEPSSKGKRRVYAAAQYYGGNGSRRPESLWDRATPKTGSYWNQRLSRAERTAYYDKVAELIKEKMKNGTT